MVMPAQIAFTGPYVADGVQTIFPYSFKIDSAAELEVMQGDALGVLVDIVPNSAYTVSGIGAADGGTVTFLVAPQGGLRILPRRSRPYSQDTDYRTGDPFLADTQEGSLDDVVQQIQQLLEELSRRPALQDDTLTSLRNIYFPRPQALKLWGWDANGTGISYYDSAITQVTPAVVADPLAVAIGWTQSSRSVNVTAAAYAGQTAIPIPALYPSGGYITSVTMHITTAFGSSGGLSTLMLGDAAVNDRWGNAIPLTLNTQTNGGYFRTEAFGVGADTPGYLTAESGVFDAVGAATITCHYEFFRPTTAPVASTAFTGGWARGEKTVTVNAVNGQTALQVPLLYPAGARIRGAVLRVTAGFGTGGGLTTITLGDAVMSDRWGGGIAVTLDTVTNAGHFRGGAFGVIAGTDGFVTAENGATFTDVGQVIVTSFYDVFTP